MQNDKLAWEIPYGTRDFLPQEAGSKRYIENKLTELFASWGYAEIVTPTIEYLATLTMGSGSALEPHMFKFFDRGGQSLALRHEMTTPIARAVASRLHGQPLPLKLSYISSVFRYEQTQMGRQCEFYQAGVELMGSAGASADAEIIALAAEAIRAIGLSDFQICLGQALFAQGLMQQYGLARSLQSKIKAAIESYDLVGLDKLLNESGLSAEAKEAFSQVPRLRGGEECLTQAYALAPNDKSREALDNLSDIYKLLQSYGVADKVCFDLGLIRDFNYYTGLVFEAYTPGLGFSLCGGGRYDNLLADFGYDCPATGFALGIERALLALERQGLTKPQIAKNVYVAYAAGKITKAIATAKELRQGGQVVELATEPETEAEAAAQQRSKGYQALSYVR